MNIFFDLDGTIIDSRRGIYKAYYESIVNIKKPKSEDLFIKNIGPPIDQILPILHEDLSLKDLKKVVSDFRSIYDNHYYLDFDLYDQMDNVLSDLSKSYDCFILTNKPIKPTLDILKKLDIKKYFKDSIGVNTYNNLGQSKYLNIRMLLKKKSLKNSQTIYIGDTYSDYKSAISNNIIFIGYTDGFYNWNFDELNEINYYYKNVLKLKNKLNEVISLNPKLLSSKF